MVEIWKSWLAYPKKYVVWVLRNLEQAVGGIWGEGVFEGKVLIIRMIITKDKCFVSDSWVVWKLRWVAEPIGKLATNRDKREAIFYPKHEEIYGIFGKELKKIHPNILQDLYQAKDKAKSSSMEAS